jgi:hypothetical protein
MIAEDRDLRKLVLESFWWKDAIKSADSIAYGQDGESKDSVGHDTAPASSTRINVPPVSLTISTASEPSGIQYFRMSGDFKVCAI